MAQVRGKWDETTGHRPARGDVLAALRLSDVPRGVMVALVVLMLAACACGWALWSSATSGVVVRRQADDVPAAAASARDEGDASEDVPRGSGRSDSRAASAIREPVVVVVDVDGAVASPGVYRLTEGARVQDAVASAGGLAPDADTSQVNLAAPVSDGQKVLIPRQGESPTPAATTGVGTAGAGTAGTQAAPGLVNINTANAALLDTLPGVGASTAQAIIDDRAQNGPFASVEDLMRVSGIGEKKFAKLKDRIRV